jgi:cytochrome d ubiquinol oxidase subunit II
VTLILVGWCLLYAPHAVITAVKPLSFYGEAAPPATLWQLCFALVVGSVFIFPSLIFLLRVFKMRSRGRTERLAEYSVPPTELSMEE